MKTFVSSSMNHFHTKQEAEEAWERTFFDTEKGTLRMKTVKIKGVQFYKNTLSKNVILFLSQVWDSAYKAAVERCAEEMEKLIVEEILICHQENTPTSRLTSLFNKMKSFNLWESRCIAPKVVPKTGVQQKSRFVYIY